MQRLASLLLSPNALLRRAQRLQARSRQAAALACTEAALRKLESREETSATRSTRGRAWSIRGSILLDLGDRRRAKKALLNAFADVSLEPDLLGFLATDLLESRDASPTARQVYLDYLARAPGGKDTAQARRNLERLREVSSPDLAAPEVLAAAGDWNRAVAAHRPDLSWPHLHLGRLAAVEADWALATRDLEQAQALEPELDREVPLLAHCLARQERHAEALAHLDRLLERSADPRALLLRAHLRHRLGDEEGAARDLALAADQAPSGGRRALAFAQALFTAGEGAGAARLLEGVPEEVRNDPYWTLLGRVHLAAHRPLDALRAWRRVADPDEDLASRRRALLHHHAASLLAAGEAAGVVALVTEGLAAVADPDVLCPLLHQALLRLARQSSGGGDRGASRGYAGSRALLAKVEAEYPPLRRFGPQRVLHGVLHGALGEHAACVEVLAPLAGTGAAGPEALYALARSALWSGDHATAAGAIERGSWSGPRGHRLLLVAAALRHDWQVARKHLGALDADGIPAHVSTAIRICAGDLQEAGPAQPDEDAHRYYRAVAAFERGDRKHGAALLEDLPSDDPWYPAARRLQGWQALAEARDHLERNRRRDALSALAEAVERWPDPEGPASRLSEAGDAALPILLDAGLRELALQVLDGSATGAGPAEPATCRRLGLFHLAESSRRARTGDLAAAIRHRERAFACLAVALSHFGYLEGWARERYRSYGAEASAEGILSLADRVTDHLNGILHHWRELLKGSDRDRSSERVEALSLSLRAELHGARLLQQLGGMPLGDGGDRIVAGPTYLALQDLSSDFGEWLATLRVKASPERRPPPRNLFQLLERLAEEREREAEGLDPETRAQLDRSFSSLRLVNVLHREGQIEQALKLLRSPERHCFPLGAGRVCHSSGDGDCPRTGSGFDACNPAFTAGDGDDLARAATDLELSLLFDRGEQEVASGSSRLAPGVDSWREALDVAEATDRHAEVAERIEKAILGRVQALASQDREDEGIELVEAAWELCDGTEVRGALGMLYGGRGVSRVNERDDWSGGVADLRRARELTPHAAWINLNLVRALRGRAKELLEDDREGAGALLREASEVTAESLAADPHNKQLQDELNQVRTEMAMVAFDPSAATGEELFEVLAHMTPGGGARLSTFFHNRGLERASAGDFESGIQDLEKALDLEPGSPETRSMLAQVLNGYAVQRANEGHLDEALGHLDRALELMPGEDGLRRNRQAIARDQAFRQLAAGEASPETLRSLLKLLQEREE